MKNRAEFEKICKLDEAIEQEGGLGLDPFGEARYDYRAIIKHAESRNIEPIDLTIRELNQFVVGF